MTISIEATINVVIKRNHNEISLFTLSCFFTSLTSQAQFTEGNIVVYRVGDGSGPINLSGLGNAVFLDEYTPGGVLVQSIPMPTTDGGGNLSLVSGSSLPEGLISRSADGQFILIPGHNSTVGANLSTGDKVVGRIDFSENLDITTTFSVTGVISSATSDDGNNIWAMAGNNTIYYNTLGSSTNAGITGNYGTGVRDVKIFEGQLYASTSNSIAAIGSGTPQTGSQSFNNLPGISENFYQFLMFDMDGSVPGVDVAYASLQYGGLAKYSLVAGTWVSNGTIGATQYTVGLTGEVDGSDITLYAVNDADFSSAGGGSIQTLTDASGYNGAFSGTFTTLVTAAANTSFRGLAFTPTQFILPVKFESINANLQHSDVNLIWKVGDVDGPVHYEIERSSNGRSFTSIGSVDSEENVLQFLDDEPLNGINCYRIRSVDYKGKINYSSVVRVDLNNSKTRINLYPSPASGNSVTLQMEDLSEGTYSVQILNVAGQLEKIFNVVHGGGSSAHTFSIDGLKPGVYILKLENDLNWSKQFIVQ